ncbi:MAG: hypothetical protein AAFU79_06955 [Myxococcota bacterium]
MTRTLRNPALSSLAAAVALLAAACATETQPGQAEVAPATPSPEPTSTPASAGPAGVGKAEAPVRIDLDAAPTGKKGQYRVTLEITALRAVPRGVVRLVVPEGVTLIEGQVERDLGVLAKDAETKLVVTVQAPESGNFVLAGGVDCHMASGVKLHRGAVFTVGEARAPAEKVGPDAVPDAELGGVRMAPVSSPED